MRKLKLFSLLLVLVLLFAGCKPTEPPAVETGAETLPPAEEKIETADAEITEFFERYVNSDVRPIAVMIDNDDENARPQAGLDEAYLIYEMVVEGGATRFLALFKNTNTAKIGPVRSSRHYFLDYVLENDAIYTHYGWSPKAEEDIPALGVKNINGVDGNDSNVFWRDKTYTSDWHSAYTSIEKIDKRAAQKKYAVQTERKNGIVYATEFRTPANGKKAEKIRLPYSSRYTTGYVYNAETKLYEKTISGRVLKMQNGNVVALKNVIVLLNGDTDLGDGSARRNINTVGNGKGYYFTNGVCEEITWSKSARGANTEYKKADGTALEINPGKTIVNIISPAIGAVIE